VECMDDLMGQSEALVNLAFNIINYQNSQSNAVLSVVSTVFLPLTFIAGIYGACM
jgi:Mg2+ and Co2+ transporter CorA